MITDNDKKAIQDIQGSAGFRVIEFLCKKKIEELDKCSTINPSSNVEGQALGRSFAVTLLTDFLSDINILQKPEGATKRTYE